MVGMAVTDAFGHWFEFLPAVDQPFSSGHGFSLAKFVNQEQPGEAAFQRPNNTFGLRLGQWTDDCSMGLCMADSLIMHRTYNGSDMRVRFWNWWNQGYCNAFRNDKQRGNRHSVGLGGNISQSIYSCQPGQLPAARYGASNHDAGNGSLMRLAPVPIFYHDQVEKAMEASAESSYTTHPGPVAAEACRLVAYIICRAIESEVDHSADAAGFLDQVTAEYLTMTADQQGDRLSGIHEVRQLIASSEPVDSTELSWNWKAPELQIERTLANRGHQYNGYPVSAGYWGSYCMDGLAVALWAVRNTKSFDDCIERCCEALRIDECYLEL
jgi:ADP-ribosyl-[dinitrogen reductase] hydrolase